MISVFVFFFSNSNILPNGRSSTYTFDLPATLHYSVSIDGKKRVAYWKAIQTDEEDKNVFLLHGFTRNSSNMEDRARMYWENGYNIYLVDNLGHGRSSSILYPSGIRYAFEVNKIIEDLNIGKPIIHGVSMGAIAASCIAQLYKDKPQKIICEALALNFDNLYIELARYTKIPYRVFPWLTLASKKIAWRQFRDLLKVYDYDVANISTPMFLIQSTTDRLFDPKDHYEKIVEIMKDRSNFDHWLVKNRGHTRMYQDSDYENKIMNFINNY